MTLPLRIPLSIAFLSGLVPTLVGCSVLLDEAATQCLSDEDCGFLGADFVCSDAVCVQDGDPTLATTTTTTDTTTSTTTAETTTTSTTTLTTSTSTTGTDADSETTETTGPAGPCPAVTSYTWSESIAVVRNACVLPSLEGSVLTGGENEVEVASPFRTLPFDICLYGELATQLWIGDNGYVAIGDGPPEALQADVGVPHSLGEPGVPGPGVVPFWDAMRPSDSGVCVALEGSAPNRTLWITWAESCFEDGSGVCDDSSQSSLTFSVGFEESSDSIIVGYVSMTGSGALSERAMGQTSITGITNRGPRACPASECDETGMCMNGSPCNYTEVAATTIRPLDTVEFSPTP